MADPLYARIARLEGGFGQMDKRMASLEGQVRDLRADVGALRVDLGSRIDRVEGRVDLVLYGLVVSILVPIFLRVFFH